MPYRVMVVEDDEILRWLMVEAVTHLGHEVTEYANADAAVLALDGAAQLSLVITDVQMPGHLDGLGLAKAIWSTRPQLPVIIVSGQTVLPPGFLPANARFITKPCTLDVLSQTLRELLSSH